MQYFTQSGSPPHRSHLTQTPLSLSYRMREGLSGHASMQDRQPVQVSGSITLAFVTSSMCNAPVEHASRHLGSSHCPQVYMSLRYPSKGYVMIPILDSAGLTVPSCESEQTASHVLHPEQISGLAARNPMGGGRYSGFMRKILPAAFGCWKVRLSKHVCPRKVSFSESTIEQTAEILWRLMAAHNPAGDRYTNQKRPFGF